MGRHANAYLLLFSHPFLVESLLRDFVPGKWLRQLDFESLEKVGASYGTDDLRSRHDDLVWRVRSREGGGWIYIYLLLEFQSTDDYFMAVRVMTYVGLLYEDLIRRKVLKRGDPLPAVLPIVVYNGIRDGSRRPTWPHWYRTYQRVSRRFGRRLNTCCWTKAPSQPRSSRSWLALSPVSFGWSTLIRTS